MTLKEIYMTCIKCSKEATFVAPKKYCNYHWAEWWAKGVPQSEAKKEAARVLKDIERRYGKK